MNNLSGTCTSCWPKMNIRLSARMQRIRDLYAEINRIGNNVNQIARSVNMGIATPETAEQSLFLLQRIYDLMYALANK